MGIINFDKRIIIYGTGNTGKKFFDKYKSEFNVYACTDSNRETVPLGGLKMISYNEIDDQNDLLVICSIHYEEIRRRLLLDGLKPYVNFVKWNIFEALYQSIKYGKKLVLTVGQCEINEISVVLSKIKSFMAEYAILYFNERKVCSHGDQFSLEEYYDCQKLLPLADIFIQPVIFYERSAEGFFRLTSQLKAGCNVFKIALFDFDSYWTQDIGKWRTVTKFYVTRMNEKLQAYANRDQCVEKMVEDNLTIREILKRINDINFFEKEVVTDNHNRSIKRAVLTDRVADVKISDYIIEMYKKQKLYCDRGHFNMILLCEYVRRVLIKLNLLTGINELEELDLKYLFEYVNEQPIYPSVAKHLDLEWINRDTKYRMITYEKVRYVSFDEYMEELVTYYIKARELLKNC